MEALELARMASDEVARVCNFSDVVGTKVILAMGRHGGSADAEPVGVLGVVCVCMCVLWGWMWARAVLRRRRCWA